MIGDFAQFMIANDLDADAVLAQVCGFLGRLSPFLQLIGRVECISLAEKCPHRGRLPYHELIEPDMCDLCPKLDCRPNRWISPCRL